MAQIFTVTCPACRGAFPCHPELWQAGYDLLCPFCGAIFPQEASPHDRHRQRRATPGSAYAAGGSAGVGRRAVSARGDPGRHAESM